MSDPVQEAVEALKSAAAAGRPAGAACLGAALKGGALFAAVFLAALYSLPSAPAPARDTVDHRAAAAEPRPVAIVPVVDQAPAVETDAVPVPGPKLIRRLLLRQFRAAGVSDSQGWKLAEQFLRLSRAADVDPLLVAALALGESSFNSAARSRNGKLGLLQIDPSLGVELAGLSGVAWQGAEALLDPEYNLKFGIGYLGYLLRTLNGRLDLAVAAFNIGTIERLAVYRSDSERSRLLKRYLRGVMELYQGWSRGLTAAAARYPQSPAGVRDLTAFISYQIWSGGVSLSESRRTAQLIVDESQRAGLDRLEFAALVKERSGFLWFAEGLDGSLGLLALTPDEGQRMAAAVHTEWSGPDRLRSREYSLRLGAAYLSLLKERHGGQPQAAAAEFLGGGGLPVRAGVQRAAAAAAAWRRQYGRS